MRSSSNDPFNAGSWNTDDGAFARESRQAPIHIQLKHETAAVHRRLEEQLGLLDPNLSRERYRRVLEAFYGFYLPVETALIRLAKSTPPLGFTLLSRHRLLGRDLVALGATPNDVDALPRCTLLPPLSSPAHLAGCLYVLEGAALGGQIIARALVRHAGMGKETGASFFAGDTVDIGARWRQVLAWLNDVVCLEDSREQTIAAAYATFTTLSRWLEARGAAE
jgi:heme oxygenase (biliverdin-IX-beta and delta-forming)